MHYGVVFPQTEFGNDIQAIKDYAQSAEALGYDYLLVYDHVLGAHPNREPRLTGQGFQHVWRRCRAQSLCGRTTKLPPRTGYEKDGHGATIWQLVQQ
jgi:hypothetical protein